LKKVRSPFIFSFTIQSPSVLEVNVLPTATFVNKHGSVKILASPKPVGPTGLHWYIIYPIPGGVAGFGSPESLESPLCIMETESFLQKKYNFPFEFTSFENGISLKATLKKNKPMTVTAGTFSASKDFDEISFDQLMQMSGRH
jgi:hypothetical protein